MKNRAEYAKKHISVRLIVHVKCYNIIIHVSMYLNINILSKAGKSVCEILTYFSKNDII